MKLLKTLLVIHIVFSILIILLILFGSELFAALGWDIPWDEMVSEANILAKDMIMSVLRGTKNAMIQIATWLAQAMDVTADALSGWVEAQTA